jgi:hypothetical protein
LVLSPTSSINLGFTTEGRLAAVLIITFSWGFQLGGYIQYSYINTAPPTSFSGAVAGEKEDFCKGSLSLPIFYFVIVLFCFIIFFLASF